ncbi:MAG: hypothetical protein ACLTSZ_13675 [Lachnospiraceae bacterium]
MEDYAPTVILIDRVDLDVIDLQERLHAAFPYLLEIINEDGGLPVVNNSDGRGVAESIRAVQRFFKNWTRKRKDC